MRIVFYGFRVSSQLLDAGLAFGQEAGDHGNILGIIDHSQTGMMSLMVEVDYIAKDCHQR